MRGARLLHKKSITLNNHRPRIVSISSHQIKTARSAGGNNNGRGGKQLRRVLSQKRLKLARLVEMALARSCFRQLQQLVHERRTNILSRTQRQRFYGVNHVGDRFIRQTRVNRQRNILLKQGLQRQKEGKTILSFKLTSAFGQSPRFPIWRRRKQLARCIGA